MNFSHLLIIAGFLMAKGSAKECKVKSSYHILEKRLPFFEARSECKKINNGSVPNFYQHRTQLLQKMHENNIKNVWIGVRRRKMAEWKWVDNSSLKNCQKKSIGYGNFDDETKNRCAILYLPDQLIEPYPCLASQICFVCILPGEAICDDKQYRKCINRQNYWITIGIQSQHSTWHSARKQCRKSGGDLVTIDTRTKLADITEEVENPPDPLDCDKLFIGLRLDHWVDSGPFTEEIPVEEGMWLDDEPLNDDDNCAELVIREGNITGLKAKDCLKPGHAICTYEESIADEVMQQMCKEDDINLIIALGTCIPLILVLLILGVVSQFYQRKRVGYSEVSKNQPIEISGDSAERQRDLNT